MIRAENLSKRYRRNDALHDVTFDVRQGSVFALVGPNGAGKSTAIKLAMNLIEPSGGRVEVLGVDSHRLGPGQPGTVPHMGRCTAMTVDDVFSEDALKILCESPRGVPNASVVLRHDASGREWRSLLTSSIGYTPGTHESWLSPVARGQAYFRLTARLDAGPGSEWVVPRQYVSALRISIRPEIPTGHALVPFELKLLELPR
jgi:energy-coupling factor transporter ATP-binding protein EcfA2